MPVSEGMWASIESQIPVKKEKPKTWLLFLMAAFLVPYFILTYQTNSTETGQFAKQNSQHTVAENSRINTLSNSNKTRHIEKEATNSFSQNDSSNEVAYQNDSEAVNFSDANANGSHLAADVTISSLQSTDLSNYLMNSESYEMDLDQITSEEENSSFNTDFYFDSEITLADNLFTATTKKLKILNNPFQKKNQQSTVGEFKLIEKSRIYKAATQVNKVSPLSERYYQGGLCYDHGKRLDNWAKDIRYERASVALCPSFEKRYSGFYVYADATYGYSIQNLNTIFPEFNNLISERNSNETGAFSMSANVGIGKKWKNGILLETGLNYDRININADGYTEQSSRRVLITIDSVMTQGGWVETKDTSFVAIDQKGLAHNKFTQFNFPVSLGYELYLQDGLSLVAKTGVLFNVSSTNSGTRTDSEGNTFIYSSDNPATRFFKTNLGLSFLGNVQIQKDLTPLFASYIGINVNYYPSNFSLADNPVEQTYTKVGLRAGILYRL